MYIKREDKEKFQKMFTFLLSIISAFLSNFKGLAPFKIIFITLQQLFNYKPVGYTMYNVDLDKLFKLWKEDQERSKRFNKNVSMDKKIKNKKNKNKKIKKTEKIKPKIKALHKLNRDRHEIFAGKLKRLRSLEKQRDDNRYSKPDIVRQLNPQIHKLRNALRRDKETQARTLNLIVSLQAKLRKNNPRGHNYERIVKKEERIVSLVEMMRKEKAMLVDQKNELSGRAGLIRAQIEDYARKLRDLKSKVEPNPVMSSKPMDKPYVKGSEVSFFGFDPFETIKKEKKLEKPVMPEKTEKKIEKKVEIPEEKKEKKIEKKVEIPKPLRREFIRPFGPGEGILREKPLPPVIPPPVDPNVECPESRTLKHIFIRGRCAFCHKPE